MPERPRVNSINDIKDNVLEFMQILEKERENRVIQLFCSFTYWYYFSNLKIFIPNIFLGYKDMAKIHYENLKRGETYGGNAKDALMPFFEETLNDEKTDLYLDLKDFFENFGKIITKEEEKVKIYKLKDNYCYEFNDIKPFKKQKTIA